MATREKNVHQTNNYSCASIHHLHRVIMLFINSRSQNQGSLALKQTEELYFHLTFLATKLISGDYYAFLHLFYIFYSFKYWEKKIFSFIEKHRFLKLEGKYRKNLKCSIRKIMEKEIFIHYYSVTPPGGQEHTLNTSTTSMYEQAHKENSPK